jgi:RimJ/RimL family protein N-acetyltransferase
MWADPQVTRYIGGKPLTEEECWSRLLRYVGHWAWMGFGYWVAEEKETGNFVGEIGFADHKRDLEPSLKGVPEIGWVFASHVHGRGYATEAVRFQSKFIGSWLILCRGVLVLRIVEVGTSNGRFRTSPAKYLPKR